MPQKPLQPSVLDEGPRKKTCPHPGMVSWASFHGQAVQNVVQHPGECLACMQGNGICWGNGLVHGTHSDRAAVPREHGHLQPSTGGHDLTDPRLTPWQGIFEHTHTHTHRCFVWCLPTGDTAYPTESQTGTLISATTPARAALAPPPWACETAARHDPLGHTKCRA